MIGRMGWEAAKQRWRKGPWTPEEDKLLAEYVNLNGGGRWSSVARSAGLNRSGKCCRLRWVNYLRPGLKRGYITPQEEGIIIELHAIWGNKWSTIAKYLPGRTDNEIKNYWRTHFRKKERSSQKQEKRRAQILKLKQKQEQEKEEEELPQPAAADKDQTAAGGDGKMDQCLPVMSQEAAAAAAAAWLDYQYLVDEGLWGGLWSLNDQQPGYCNKIAMQIPTYNSFGGDASNLYNGGYII
ncbi:hypothetical protein DITRI_Ditri13aG0157000 [Diplodiscus trichospermus]